MVETINWTVKLIEKSVSTNNHPKDRFRFVKVRIRWIPTSIHPSYVMFVRLEYRLKSESSMQNLMNKTFNVVTEINSQNGFCFAKYLFAKFAVQTTDFIFIYRLCLVSLLLHCISCNCFCRLIAWKYVWDTSNWLEFILIPRWAKPITQISIWKNSTNDLWICDELIYSQPLSTSVSDESISLSLCLSHYLKWLHFNDRLTGTKTWNCERIHKMCMTDCLLFVSALFSLCKSKMWCCYFYHRFQV